LSYTKTSNCQTQPEWLKYAESLVGLPIRVPNRWWGKQYKYGFTDCTVDEILEHEACGDHFGFWWNEDAYKMDFNAVVTYADKMAAKDKGMDLKPPNNIVNELMKKKKRPRTTNNVRLPCPYHV